VRQRVALKAGRDLYARAALAVVQISVWVEARGAVCKVRGRRCGDNLEHAPIVRLSHVRKAIRHLCARISVSVREAVVMCYLFHDASAQRCTP
jgi:hypothetical protein